MACSQSTSSSSDEDLSCSICLDVFEDPRMLKCKHTFCYKCIIKLCKGASNRVTCPMCREISAFENITKHIDLIDKLQSYNSSHHEELVDSDSSESETSYHSLSELECSWEAPTSVVTRHRVYPKKSWARLYYQRNRQRLNKSLPRGYKLTSHDELVFSSYNLREEVTFDNQCVRCFSDIYNVLFKCCLCSEHNLCLKCVKKENKPEKHPMCCIRDKLYRSNNWYTMVLNAKLTKNNYYYWHCDECGEGLDELHFKCFFCQDFDLCVKCEAAGCHSIHPKCRVRTIRYQDFYQDLFKESWYLKFSDFKCNGCRFPIVGGPRFRCCVCLDFHLCFRCEDAGVHKHHPLLYLPNESLRFEPSYLKLCQIIPKYEAKTVTAQTEGATPSSNQNKYLFADCIECQERIYGVRYKCCLCDNYDICEECEGRKLHLEHPMLSIRNMAQFDQIVFPLPFSKEIL